ncbi:hypothetical protein ACH4E7_38225 [Kitasatospora sp. NPDC018058]|uniref:hypothetical protein n=1 Tax=Kitasatospora sp. NPDC018058 TaxID=3364025 RepID=UPI0037BECA5B
MRAVNERGRVRWRRERGVPIIKVMADSVPSLSHDAFHLSETARGFGWDVTRDNDILTMSLLDWRVYAVLRHDGGFRYARATGPGSTAVKLTLQEVLDVLEEYGSPAPPAP